MGLKYDSGESQQMISALQETISLALAFIQQAESGIDQLVSSVGQDGITGKAYESGKNLFSGQIKNKVQELKRATDKLKRDLAKYKSANQKVSHYGHIDEEHLEETKSHIQKQISNLKNMQHDYQRKSSKAHDSDLSLIYRSFASKIQWQIDGQHEGLHAIEKELDDLRNYNQRVSGLFETGIKETMHVQSSFDSSGIKSSSSLMKGHDKKTIIKNFEKAYGLDHNTAEDLYEFTQKFNKYAVKMKWSRQETAYQFARFIASLSTAYSGKPWRIAGGTLLAPEAINILSKAGFSKNFLSGFSDHLSKNHINKSKKAKNDFVHTMGSLSVILHQYKTNSSLTGSINDQASNFMMRLGTINVYNDDPIRSYFVMSNGLPGFFVKNMLTDNNVKADATYRGDIASGPKGISSNDVKSDFDALNLANRMQNGDSLEKSINGYGNYLNSGNNRVCELYKSLGDGNINEGRKEFKRQVFKPTTDPGSIAIRITTPYYGPDVKATDKFWHLVNEEEQK